MTEIPLQQPSVPASPKPIAGALPEGVRAAGRALTSSLREAPVDGLAGDARTALANLVDAYVAIHGGDASPAGAFDEVELAIDAFAEATASLRMEITLALAHLSAPILTKLWHLAQSFTDVAADGSGPGDALVMEYAAVLAAAGALDGTDPGERLEAVAAAAERMANTAAALDAHGPSPSWSPERAERVRDAARSARAAAEHIEAMPAGLLQGLVRDVLHLGALLGPLASAGPLELARHLPMLEESAWELAGDVGGLLGTVRTES
ncbi:hypothetical protein AB0I28_32545 [Phytomonospora sp. NPDC050363]|uniref:hypothetical protein n=1 Tax=Phytomonospora sp. NPDC050363 TaxID=3155642 RepID=UPI0033F14559